MIVAHCGTIYLSCVAIILPFGSILYFPVKEFDEEIDGEIHHRHHLLSTVALVASPGYDMAAEDPSTFSDPESEPFIRAWPDQAIPR